jgi:hypothetical protein
MKKKWHIRSGDIREIVYAADQFAAWDTLRDRPAEEFGLIAEAEPDEDTDPYLVRTSLLMIRWNRDDDARRFVARGMEEGMPDTTAEDLKSAGR